MINKTGVNLFHNSSLPNIPKSGATPLKLIEKIKVIWIKTIYRGILFSWKYLAPNDFRASKKIFGRAKSIVKTRNIVRIDQIKEAVLASRKPPTATEYSSSLEPYGILKLKEESFKVFNKGICFGSVLGFLQASIESSPSIAAEEFRGGAPLQALRYQNASSNIGRAQPIEILTRECMRIIEEPNYKSENETIEEFLVLKETVREFVNENHTFKNFTKSMRQKLLQKGYSFSKIGKGILRGVIFKKESQIQRQQIYNSIIHSTMKAIEEHFEKTETSRFKNHDDIINFCGLSIEKRPHKYSQATSVLSEINQLEPGFYQISLPVLNMNGKLRAYHVVGLIVGKEGSSSYFYDPNFAIGEFDKKDLHDVLQHTFEYYSFASVLRIRKIFKNFAKTSASVDYSLVKLGKLNRL